MTEEEFKQAFQDLFNMFFKLEIIHICNSHIE